MMTELEQALSTIALALGIDIEIKGKVQEGQPEPKGYNERAMAILNAILNTSYKHTTPTTIGMLKHLRENGYDLKDIEKVVRFKHSEWANDIKMKKFLRPATLFQVAKFENYLNEANQAPTNKMYDLMKDDWE